MRGEIAAAVKEQNKIPSDTLGRDFVCVTGDYLISQAVSNQVPSAYGGLTAVCGMGTGGTPQLSPPDAPNLSGSRIEDV